MASRVLVIAEPGCTHEGSLDRMKDLIGVAKSCGADVFKNQWVSDVDAMVRRRRAEDYRRFYSWLNYPLAWHAILKAECAALGMQYACSVYLPQDVWPVALFVDILKVSSFEAGDRAVVATAYVTSRRVLVSDGLNSGQDERWCSLSDSLHCVSAYPAPLDQMNLTRMARQHAGLSDHSRNVLTGAVAVGAGAKIIEAHFRLDDCDPENPDYAVAFSPAEFRQYIQNIRDAELMMGDGVKRVMPCEEPMLKHRVLA